jgi:hypothetical protein
MVHAHAFHAADSYPGEHHAVAGMQAAGIGEAGSDQVGIAATK